MLWHHHRVFEREVPGSPISLGDHHLIFDHDIVETSALERLRHLHVETTVPGVAAIAERFAPFVGREIHEPSEMERPRAHWSAPQKQYTISRLLSVCLVSLARKKYAANKICSEKCFCRLQWPHLVQQKSRVACAIGSEVSRSDRDSGIVHGREANPRAQRRNDNCKF